MVFKKINFTNKSKYLYIIVSGLLLSYIIIVNFYVKFSISVSLCFFVGAMLSLAKFIMKLKPINKEEREPSFIYIFLNIAFKAYFAVMIGIIMFNIIYYKDVISKYKTYDYIIVFGGNIDVDNKKNFIVNSRVDKAIELAKENENVRVILTGAKLSGEIIEEAYYMKNYMVKGGIELDRLFTDILSTNTNENIENALYIIKEDVIRRNRRGSFINAPFDRNKNSFDARFLNIGFLSSEFHLTRISMMAKNKGVKRPYVISVNSLWYLLPYYYVRENLSLIKAMALSQLKFF